MKYIIAILFLFSSVSGLFAAPAVYTTMYYEYAFGELLASGPRPCRVDENIKECALITKIIVVRTIEIDMGVGGSYNGTLNLDDGDIVEEHYPLSNPQSKVLYYPSMSNYTLQDSFIIEITECEEYPEIVGS